MEDVGLFVLLFKFLIIAAILERAVANLKAIRNQYQAGGSLMAPVLAAVFGVALCFSYEIGAIGMVIGKKAEILVGGVDGAWLDMVITGLTLAGGAGAVIDLARSIEERRQQLQELKNQGGGN